MKKRLRIIHSNDLHSCFDNMAKMATLMRKLKDESTILLDAGDFNDFSNAATFGSNGKCGLFLLKKLDYSALAVGNNEGFLSVDLIQKMGNYRGIALLSCNIKNIDSHDVKGIKASVVIKKNGLRILIIGASPYVESYNTYYNLYDLQAKDPSPFIKQEQKKHLGKYDICILLSHMGFIYDSLLAKKNLGIDIIIGGHSHSVIDLEKINKTYITHSGVKGSHLGLMDVEIEDNKITIKQSINIPLDKVENDKPFSKIIGLQRNKAYKKLKHVVGIINNDLIITKDEECSVANFFSDSLKDFFDCDFSLINSGLLSCGFNKGKVSKLDIIKACPSPINIVTCCIKGSNILKALQESCSKEKCLENGSAPGFRGDFLGKLHVSHNVKIRYIDNKIKEVLINDVPLNPNKEYLICTTDYNQRGKGYPSLGINTNAKYYPYHIRDIISKYINNKDIIKKSHIYRWDNYIL